MLRSCLMTQPAQIKTMLEEWVHYPQCPPLSVIICALLTLEPRLHWCCMHDQTGRLKFQWGEHYNSTNYKTKCPGTRWPVAMSPGGMIIWVFISTEPLTIYYIDRLFNLPVKVGCVLSFLLSVIYVRNDHNKSWFKGNPLQWLHDLYNTIDM